jgi:hypothetical protein
MNIAALTDDVQLHATIAAADHIADIEADNLGDAEAGCI